MNQIETQEPTDKVNSWVQRISEQEMPIFKFTAESIVRTAALESASSSDLANVILQDASLTARILKLANSHYYNPGRAQINTISRAVIFIGFDKVRDMSLSMAIIDALLKNKPKARVMNIMSQAFMASVQARKIAELGGDEAPEEVFIATLLRELGEMAFWCVAKDEGDAIIEEMENADLAPKEAQQKILGFTFSQLTLGLTQNWQLGDLISSAINSPNLANPRIQSISLATEVGEQILNGWESAGLKKSVSRLGKHLGINEKEAQKLVKESAEEAIKMANNYGAKEAAKLLSSSDKSTAAADGASNNEEELTANASYTDFDPLLQLNILRDLSSVMDTEPDLNLVFDLVLEGIYRSIGMDRTLLALLTKDKTQLRCKHIVGVATDSLSRHFSFPYETEHPNIFAKVLQDKSALWVKNSKSPTYEPYMNPHIHNTLGAKEYFLSPILVKGKAIGLLYADRLPSKRELDEASFESFNHFSQQTCMAIQYITSRS